MSGEFDSRKDSQSTKFERRRRIFVKLSFRELSNSKLSGLHAFDNTAIIHNMAVETHFHCEHGTETTLVFLPPDGNASWLLLPSLVSLLSGGTVQPENTYSCILKVTGQVWVSQK